MQIYIHTPFNKANQIELLTKFSDKATLVFGNELTKESAIEASKNANIILGNPPAKWFENKLLNLKLWQLDSAGFDGYKHLKLNVPVCNLKDYFSIPCAETIVAGILAFYRKIDELTILKSKNQWVGASIRQSLNVLSHKRVIILGAGGIGQAVKKILSGFDCQISMMARSNPDATIFTIQELMDILPNTDLVINCLPGTATGFFTAQMIGKMPENAIFANIGRGSTVDENALIEALQTKKIAGAVLDVTEIEPLPIDNPLWNMENVILTQHSGGGQMSEEEGKLKAYIENVGRFFNNEPLLNIVNLERGY